MSKKKNHSQLYITQEDMDENTVETILMSAIGRKRSGCVRMQYITGVELDTPSLQFLATIVSYKFYRDMNSTDHQLREDRPLIDDLIGSDLPWAGYVRAQDPVMDERYILNGYIRTLIQSKDFVYQLRDLQDGSPHADGLSIFEIQVAEDGAVDVVTQTGLKQIEVVELFQGYNDSLLALKDYLVHQGYVYVRDQPNQMKLVHNGEVVSTIDITLVGTTRMRS